MPQRAPLVVQFQQFQYLINANLTSFFLGFHFHQCKAVSVLFFPPSAEDHSSSEERDTVEVGEDHRQTGVQTEQLHCAELRDRANSKCKYI